MAIAEWVKRKRAKGPQPLRIIHHEDDWYRSGARLRSGRFSTTQGLLFLRGAVVSFEEGSVVRFSADVRIATFEWSRHSFRCRTGDDTVEFHFPVGAPMPTSRELCNEWRQVIEAAQAGTTLPTS